MLDHSRTNEEYVEKMVRYSVRGPAPMRGSEAVYFSSAGAPFEGAPPIFNSSVAENSRRADFFLA